MRPGDLVELRLDSEKLQGHVLPSPEGRDDIIVLKLSSGYNLIIRKEDVHGSSILDGPPAQKPAPVASKKSKGLPKVTLLHTGGTIAARVDYALGAVKAGFITADELLAIYPELGEYANVSCRMVCNIASEDMRFGHYNLILQAIKEEIEKGAEAIIIPHGTDTLHYSAAALAFGLEGLRTPVLLVGSQRSSDRGSSDAFTNLLAAVIVATKSDFGGVGVCMHHASGDDAIALIPPMRARKMHTARRDAFRAINATPYALIDALKGSIRFLQDAYPRRGPSSITVKGFDENLKIGFLKAHPNMVAQEVLFFEKFDAVIIEGTGLGHVPNAKNDALSGENERVFAGVEKLVKAGVFVVAAPQTLYGRIHFGVYTPLRRMREAGVLGHLCDMTPETAFIKVAWLLSNFPRDEARDLYEKDVRGEISMRLESTSFLA